MEREINIFSSSYTVYLHSIILTYVQMIYTYM